MSKRIEIAPPAITFNDPADDAADGCEFDAADLASAQALLDADLAAWVTAQQEAFAAAGGCDPVVTNDFLAQSVALCDGGSFTITWTITDLCQTETTTATFNVTPPNAVYIYSANKHGRGTDLRLLRPNAA
ncbi:hypothetical protein [uncultured Sunxiuqinia sp.]|uniref:hypothetical protein n=1 Tax=uncultured Sunxiuqinia sp. TaxID=1573825 RepID=UPI002AA687D4|nr:hypothetical protein [uncultured Sunxiuqinia sp.]